MPVSLIHSVRCCRLMAMLAVIGALAALTGAPPAQSAASDVAVTYKEFIRSDFNRRAAERFLPLFWRADTNHDQTLQADELAVLWGYGDDDPRHWVIDGKFTAQFQQAYRNMLKPDRDSPDVHEQVRHQLVVAELAQGRPVLVATSLSHDSPVTVNMVRHLLNAASSIERIYAQQKGVANLAQQIADDDSASRMLFMRNQGPFCEAPKTESNPACSALAIKPPHVVGLYPAAIQSSNRFCDLLAHAPNAPELMNHFSVVALGTQPDTFTSIPYHQAYTHDMQAVASELLAAARGLGADETAFKNYLFAAAQAFQDNDWEPANRAWVAMNASNSKWYARIAPDEVYYEPCAWKAGFALQLARINPDSLAWQKKLDPLKAAMEQRIAQLAGAPYQARKVAFKLPDFIDVVLNAGDQRNAHGATIGQSLPNWGPVAEAGGRTVAMTNLYTDVDSQAQLAKQMASLFCTDTNRNAVTGSKESLISSLLHEAAHNLGPAHDYQVNGQIDSVAFGGPLAATLEELKAQTSSMYLTQWLMGKGVFTAQEVVQIHLQDVAWGFGHIARGMYAADGTPRNYSQLAAIQIGSFLDAHAISWHATEIAANGADRGCFTINFKTLPAAIDSLEGRVLKIKATNNKADAQQLLAKYVDDQDAFTSLKAVITERWSRAPKATFVYSVSY